MNFADLQPANLHPVVGWWLINQGEEWIDKWGSIKRLREMDDDYIINLHRFLGDKKYGAKLVKELAIIALNEQRGPFSIAEDIPFSREDCDAYFKETPLWRAIAELAYAARMRKALRDGQRKRVYFYEGAV